jgi:multiple sugar transport system permease protein
LFNSVLVSLGLTIGLVTTSSMAAYAFSRLHFRGRDTLFFGYLATLMIPNAVVIIPVFILLKYLGWINTYYALILPGMFSAYGTFLLRQFFMAIPVELEEAAALDGCSTFRIYWSVILPLSKPALTALTILVFMSVWRGLLWPLIVTQTETMFTLPVALSQFQEIGNIQWSYMMAGSVIMIIPMLFVFAFGQRYFIEGIRLGAVKG